MNLWQIVSSRGRMGGMGLVLLTLLAGSAAAQALLDPVLIQEMTRIGVMDTWQKYDGKLSWGKGQTVALLDDGCNPSAPEWNVQMAWGPKTILPGYDAVDQDSDPSPGPAGYHGASIGYASSLNYHDEHGVAYNDSVINVRAVSVVHTTTGESPSMARALQWVIDHRQQYNITAVNLAPVDDQAHSSTVATEIDAKLTQLRQLGVWVSSPGGNHGYASGISWPACQSDCFAIGATQPDADVAYLDRCAKTDILVSAQATSTANALIVGCSTILREAIEKSGFDWHAEGATVPDAMMAIFKKTGVDVYDPGTGVTFKRLDLLAAIDYVNAISPIPSPEPSTLILSTTGLLGMLYYAWKRCTGNR